MRNFGLGHYRNLRRIPSRPGDVFSCPSPNWPALGAGLFYSREASLEGKHHAFGKTERPSGQLVAVGVTYQDRILFKHVPLTHIQGADNGPREAM